MKRTYLILIVLSVALAGCHNKQKKETSTPEPQEPKDTTIIAGVYHFQFTMWNSGPCKTSPTLCRWTCFRGQTRKSSRS